MGQGFWDRDAATVLSPAVGAVAPAICLWLQGGAGMDAIAIGGPCVWAIVGLALSYAIALPLLVVARRFGVRGLLALWVVAAFVGTPVGYLWADPTLFADDPGVAQTPHWASMFEYMALFGVTGLLYAAGASRQRTRT